MKVSVIGLGAMGLPMATCLAEKFEVTAFDIAQARCDLAREAGVTIKDSSRDAVEGTDYTLVAVRNQQQLENLLYGDAGIAHSMKEGAGLIITSTIGIAPVVEVAKKLKEESGIEVIDAPISGGPVRAGKGDLLVTVGAYQEVFDAALPVLNQLASTLVHVGNEPGKGQAMKTVNQLLCGVHIAAAGEALALAGQLGLDQTKALEALMGGAAASFMLGDRGPRAIQAYNGEEAEVRSRLDIFVKDMGIVTSAAKVAGMAVPVASATEQLYLQGLSRGQAAQDDSSVIKLVQPVED
ncbi:NAD(P)-dependent oxidoreductase [Actinotignum urinale]|uniref:NAD(P)-dependent oxidoreductase n=2 Tax=Actinotignum urinale TaxID=190146 RepID=A0AAW9HNF3_9ACTO|nr:NAD(P)-dependent oxidoreductase [Actinotignum urinale]MDY5151806.1 NAD(P)-dependent oxidoreductase [Actinotignum urinale]MDY5155302.1 NAD(P)-dependent oxidoreductase [Actinotignum urinale]MDY5160000.1 NAD(P)-dependent oxidoreductase [Actinotignum urinale]